MHATSTKNLIHVRRHTVVKVYVRLYIKVECLIDVYAQMVSKDNIVSHVLLQIAGNVSTII